MLGTTPGSIRRPLFGFLCLALLAGGSFAAAPSGAQAQTETLRPLAGNTAPVPVPDTAEDVDYDGEDGKLDFNSASSVKAIATFFREALKPLGWKESPSVINRSNMVVLNFSKGQKDLSFTILQMGPKVNVSVNGSGLIAAAAKPAAPGTAPAADAPAQAAQDLEAEEMSGFPVPKQRESSGVEKTPFRRQLNVNVSADVASVLAFYRRELTKLSWKEDTQGAIVKSDQATVAFVSPDGPAVLKLSRKNKETVVSLALRNQAEAAKAGMVPKPGQAKVLFGNIVDAEAVVTINKQTVKVGAGVGAKKPDGPTLDLPPGKYKFSFKVGNKPAQTDDVEIGADETWGLLIGPGGVLTLHVY